MKTNILYYEPSTGYGGSSKCLLGWMKHLDRNKFLPLVVTHFNGPTFIKLKSEGIKIVQIPYISIFKKLLLSFQQNKIICYPVFSMETIINIIPISLLLAILIKIKNIKLVDINSSIVTGIPAIIASKLTNTPCICHIHDTRKLTRKEKFFAKWISKIIVLTQKAQSLCNSELKNANIAVVYNGLNPTEWKITANLNEIKEEFNFNETNSIIGMVGRITKGKGHDDFIEAAKIISKTNSNVKFLIVGDAILIDEHWKQELKDRVAKSDLSASVVFVGWRNDVREIMSTFDILIFPTSSFPEGFGLSCIEAMALEKPVIATNIPGPSEIVLDGVTGFLVPPAKPDILAEKIIFLINNPQIAKNFGYSGRQRVEKLFNIEKCTEEIENIYFEILNTSPN